MKTILFPTDFSENTIHASRYAGIMAKFLDANVILLHVYHAPTMPAYEISSEIKDAFLQNEQEITEQLQAFTNVFSKDAGVPLERITQKVEYGFTAEKTVEIAESMNVDLIVMGTEGASDMLDKWLGTHTQEVMKKAKCPVFTVPKDVSINYPHKILYAADFKDDEIQAVQKVLDIAKPLGAICKVVHIHEEFEPNIGHFIEETIKELQIKFKNEDITVQQFRQNDTIEGLEAYMKTYEPDVLAIAIHDKSFLDNLFTTSVSQHFIQASKIPMLTFKK